MASKDPASRGVNGQIAVDNDGFRVSAFVVRRVFAAAYGGFFLSLATQADGLFGCDGVFPPKNGSWFVELPGGPSLVLLPLTLVGAILAGLQVFAAAVVERNAGTCFALLWVLAFGCIRIAAAAGGGKAYPMSEDQLLLEAGLFAPMLVATGDSQVAVRCRRVGRALAAWLLFRTTYAAGLEKLVGSCSAWRDLTAFKDSWQIEVFPLPPTWPLWLAPTAIIRALCWWRLYVQLILAPLVVAPWRAVSATAVGVQLIALGADALVANRGNGQVVVAALCFALLGDGWHQALLSEDVLSNWGLPVVPKTASDEADESGDEEEEEKEEEDDEDKEWEKVPQAGTAAAVEATDAAKDADSMKSATSATATQNGAANSSTDAAGSGSMGVVWSLLCIGAGYVGTVTPLLLDPSAAASSLLGPLQQSPELAAAAGALIGSCASVASGARAAFQSPSGVGGVGAVGVLAAGVALWAAGGIQFARDVITPYELQLPPLQSAGQALEAAFISHPQGSAKIEQAWACPHPLGRADVVLQGVGEIEIHDATTGYATGKWISLSSRYLPVNAERRPIWLQPYTPRLDVEMWRLAQKQDKGQKLPKWVMRVLSGLAHRDGAAARLAAGHWNGTSTMLYGVADPLYARVQPPITTMRALLKRDIPMRDPHSNKWWNATAMHVVRQMELDELQLKAPPCQPLPTLVTDVPFAEALLAFFVAAIMAKIIGLLPGGVISSGNSRKRRR